VMFYHDSFQMYLVLQYLTQYSARGLRGRDRLVVGFTSTYTCRCNQYLSCYSNEQSNDLNYDFSNATKKSNICIKPSVLCNKKNKYKKKCKRTRLETFPSQFLPSNPRLCIFYNTVCTPVGV
jgi:hypothetical protein